MNANRPPLATILLLTYALALAGLVIALLATAVTIAYPEPTSPNGGWTDYGPDNGERYRAFGLIFGLVGAALMGGGVLALDSRYNAVRTALLAAGAVLTLTGVGFAVSGDTNWLSILVSAVGVAVLAASARYLEDGLRWRHRPAVGPAPPAPSA